MSLKPPKKSDLGKKWMNERKSKKIKIQPERHLIVTEGTVTEPQYFKSMCEIINRDYREKLQLKVVGAGDNTLNLLNTAKDLAKRSANTYKHVWVVYDTDSFPAEHINKTAEECTALSTEETIYHATWSNQCIELWFLLHFGLLESDLHRTEYFPKLTDWLDAMGEGAYEKGRKDMYRILRPFMDDAIRNAKQLDLINTGKSPAKSAPGTKVYELVETLRPYLTE